MKKILIIIFSIVILIGCSKEDNKEIIETNPYYERLANINNVNGGFVVEDEDYIYIANAKNDSKLLKIDKKTKETIDLLEGEKIANITNLSIYNNKIYFFTPKTDTFDGVDINDWNEEFAKIIQDARDNANEATIYSIEKDGSKLTKTIEDKEEKGIENITYIDNYIYYNTTTLGQYNNPIKKSAEYNLITKKSRIIEDNYCLYLYNNETNYLCLKEGEVKRYDIELALLNKETLEIGMIKSGIFDETINNLQPLYIDNKFYFMNYENNYIRKIESFDLMTNELKEIFNLNNFVEDEKEVIVGFVVKDDSLFIRTGIFEYEYKDNMMYVTSFDRFYQFKNNEIVLLYDYLNIGYSTGKINLTEDYVIIQTNNYSSQSGVLIKIFDYEGNEIKFDY